MTTQPGCWAWLRDMALTARDAEYAVASGKVRGAGRLILERGARWGEW